MSKKPLTKKLFLEKLSIHGADFKRWEHVDPAQAEALLEKSDDLRPAYEEAKALDDMLSHYNVPQQNDNNIVDETVTRIEKEKVVSFTESAQRKKGFGYVWGGGVAIAASILLLMFVQQPPQTTTMPSALKTANQGQVPETASRTVASVAAPAEVVTASLDDAVVSDEELFATWNAVIEDSLAQTEILALFDMAMNEASVPDSDVDSVPQTNQVPDAQDIDTLLEQIYMPQSQDDTQLEQELDLWDLYLKSEG